MQSNESVKILVSKLHIFLAFFMTNFDVITIWFCAGVVICRPSDSSDDEEAQLAPAEASAPRAEPPVREDERQTFLPKGWSKV